MDLSDFIALWQRRFWASLAVLTLLLGGLAWLSKYELISRESVPKFSVLRENLYRMRAATTDAQNALKTIRALLPENYDRESTEMLLFSGVDSLKARYPDSAVSISIPPEFPEISVIDFSVTLTNCDYPEFMNHLSWIQSRVFPSLVVRNVSITTPSDVKGAVTYLIEGTVTTRKTGKERGNP